MNMKHSCVTAAAMAVLCWQPAVLANGNGKKCLEFASLAITLQANETDGDAEVFISAIGQDDGLQSLDIWGPSKRKIASVEASKKGIGLREFVLESAEIAELDKVLAAFPEGNYRFYGRTVAGDCLRGNASLSHLLAIAPAILTPAENEIVPTGNFVVSWAAVPGAQSYTVEVKNNGVGNNLVVRLPAPASSFQVPQGWLQSDAEYQVAVTANASDGNSNGTEFNVTTAE